MKLLCDQCSRLIEGKPLIVKDSTENEEKAFCSISCLVSFYVKKLILEKKLGLSPSKPTVDSLGSEHDES